jgi:glycosyltransferase involved in cell wall biosynthesis
MVAAFREEKRHVDALSAFKLLQASYPDVSFVCVGNNDYSSKQRLERFAKDNEIKNVTLLSASEAGEVRNYYWASDLFTLTSNKVETFSISALEALSCGIPCVLTNIGGAKDFISDMENGCLVEPNDFDSIKNGWLKILNNLLSFNKSELRNRIVLNYSIQKSASKYIELIKEKTL